MPTDTNTELDQIIAPNAMDNPTSTAAAAAIAAKAAADDAAAPHGRKADGTPRKRAGRPRKTTTDAPKASAATNGKTPPAPKTTPSEPPAVAPKASAANASGGETRRAQAVRLITKNPGATTPDIATQMGIKQNYLYRVLPALEADGVIRRDGHGWHATGKTDAGTGTTSAAPQTRRGAAQNAKTATTTRRAAAKKTALAPSSVQTAEQLITQITDTLQAALIAADADVARCNEVVTAATAALTAATTERDRLASVKSAIAS